MNALLRRLRPGRREPADAAGDDTGPIPAASPADGGRPPVPAGVAPEDLVGERPDTRRRGRLRRRVRHLRQLRELMLRDVGGLVYELHRAPPDDAVREQAGRVVEAKLERLSALDAERRELEATLGDVRAETVVREPGVGGACPGCGEYFASDARFCSRCGTRVDGGAPAPAPAPAPAAAGAEHDDAQPGEHAATPAEPALDPAPIEEPVTEVRS